MKKVNPNLEKLFECYCMSDNESDRKDICDIAKSILDYSNYMSYLDKLIHYHNCELMVIENSLGLS